MIVLENVSWVSGKQPNFTISYLARTRYRQPLQKCGLFLKNERVAVSFEGKKQMAAAQGQSLVIYKGKEMIGGGTIDKDIKKKTGC